MGNCLGFGPSGVVGGSCAAGLQSVCYGGYVPAGSCFSICQSLGARGCGILSTLTGLLVFIIGVLMIILGVMLGFYPAMLGTVNSKEITRFAEEATEISLVSHYQYMIAVGVFMAASCILYFCCAGLFSVVSLVLIIVYLGLTANTVATFNQYKSSPAQSGWQQRLQNKFYHGEHPYPRIRLMLNESLQEEMASYEESGEMMDRIQEQLECCGVLGVSDWESQPNRTVPASCYEREQSEIYQASCLDQMEFQIFKVHFWSSISVLPVLSLSVIVQLLLLIGSCFGGD